MDCPPSQVGLLRHDAHSPPFFDGVSESFMAVEPNPAWCRPRAGRPGAAPHAQAAGAAAGRAVHQQPSAPAPAIPRHRPPSLMHKLKSMCEHQQRACYVIGPACACVGVPPQFMQPCIDAPLRSTAALVLQRETPAPLAGCRIIGGHHTLHFTLWCTQGSRMDHWCHSSRAQRMSTSTRRQAMLLAVRPPPLPSSRSSWRPPPQGMHHAATAMALAATATQSKLSTRYTMTNSSSAG